MEFFLPIAEVYVSLPFIFILSLAVGILSGLFGVGGGFLMTPFLIFLGIPPAYAVPNEANNILGTSISGSTTHYLKGTLDYKMGLMIVVGGVVGTALGIYTFSYFQDIGKINIVISLAYMYILAIIGTMMLVQGVTEIDRARKKIIVNGFLVGFIAAILGVGGAFILVPAMIYIIGMPTKLIPGTSLFVTIFVSAIVTVLHAFNYGTIDLILVTVLILGSILGVQIGQKLGERVDSSQFKTILAVLLLLVGVAIAYDTFFAAENVSEIYKNSKPSLGPVSEFVRDLSKNAPFLYGMASIVLALGLGVGAAVLRKVLSKLKDKYIPKPTISTK